MALQIETFANVDARSGWRPGNNYGGSSLFKALGHPKTVRAGHDLVARLKGMGRIGVYDPMLPGAAEHFDAFFGLRTCRVEQVFVQRLEDAGRQRLGHVARPVTALRDAALDALFICAFDAEAYVRQLGPYLPPGLPVVSLDDMRLPAEWLSVPGRYLDPVNFATNFALFIDDGDRHTRLTTANYWGRYGAAKPRLWLCLFDADGAVLADWIEDLPAPLASVRIDSRAIRQRLGLGPFTGSLFIHALNVQGHDVVKYALDFFAADGAGLMCTHDANAWPADLYAGVPAADGDERILLHVQNSHPVPIPAGGFGVNVLGEGQIAWFDQEVPPFATRTVDLNRLLPAARWPDQIEIQAGRYFVRPRYEVVGADGRRRMNHANVERTDLQPDPSLKEATADLGKGFIMPLPVPPMATWRTVALVTPMSTAQQSVPVRAALVDASGQTVAEKFLGNLPRRSCPPVDLDAWLQEAAVALPSGYGHIEFLYDFRAGGDGDGWLHALAKIEHRATGQMAETIFGAHVYNVPVTWRDEPQSYTHKPPGLTTRLFLRVGDPGADTLCHLIYPASRPWRPQSSTILTLHDAEARPVARREVAIACGGSLFWRTSEMFSADERRAAGAGAWVEIRDTTCRLFGFHGLLAESGAGFCLDHMFGF